MCFPRPRRVRNGPAALLLAAIGLAAPAVATVSADALLIRRPGRGSAARLAAAVEAEFRRQGGTLRVLELSGDAPADSARLSREARTRPLLFAIGPDAAEIAGQVGDSAVVSLGVPNPAQVRTPGTYISIYPRLEGVMSLLSERLGVRKVGVLFSPAQNREIGLAFIRAGQAAGVSVQPLPVGSSGELIRQMRSGLSGVDALLLPVDPILFDRRSLEYVVEEAQKAKIPTVGFLEGLESLGVTLAVVADPESAAAAAVSAAGDPVMVGKKRVEVDGSTLIVSRAGAAAVGLEPDALGGQQVR